MPLRAEYPDYGMPDHREHVPNVTLPTSGAQLASANGSAPVLRGHWRHSHGMIFCGTLRIAKGDFDTNPHPDFCARVFDDICRTMNEAQNIDYPTGSDNEPMTSIPSVLE